jgi:hypothetical protein
LPSTTREFYTHEQQLKPLPNFQTSNPRLNRKGKKKDKHEGFGFNQRIRDELEKEREKGVEGIVEQRRRQDRA